MALIKKKTHKKPKQTKKPLTTVVSVGNYLLVCIIEEP